MASPCKPTKSFRRLKRAIDSNECADKGSTIEKNLLTLKKVAPTPWQEF